MKRFIIALVLILALTAQSWAAISYGESTLTATLKTNTTSDGWQKGLGLLYPGGTATLFGDSISASPSIYSTALATMVGWTLTNNAQAGRMTAELPIMGAIFTNNVATNSRSLALLGFNSVRYWGNDAKGLAMESNCVAAAAVWLTTPKTSILLGNNPNISYGGAWATSGTYPNTLDQVTTSVGATATAKVSGKTVYLCSMGFSGTGGSFSVTIDGVSQGTFNTGSIYLATENGTSYAPLLLRFPNLADSLHTVVLTVTSSGLPVHLTFLSGSGAYSANGDGPIFWLGNCLGMTPTGYANFAPYNKATDAIVALYNAQMASIAGNMSSDGANVFYVNMNGAYNAATDVSGDDVHPKSPSPQLVQAMASAIAKPNWQRNRALMQTPATVVSGGGGAAGGSPGQVQVNSAGALAGSAATISGSTLSVPILSASTSATIQDLTVSNNGTVGGKLSVGPAVATGTLSVQNTTAGSSSSDIRWNNPTAYAAGTPGTWNANWHRNDSSSASVAVGEWYLAGNQGLGGMVFRRDGSTSDRGYWDLLTYNGSGPVVALSVDPVQVATFSTKIIVPTLQLGSSSGPDITSGTGSPEGVVTKPVGSIFLRTDGGTGTTEYRKETGAGNTGWIAAAAGGGSVPTGSGFTHITSGAQDGAARAVDVSSADVTGTLAAGSFPALTGDITTTAGSLATTLGAAGTAGTYTKVTTDAKGRVTSGAKVDLTSSADVTLPGAATQVPFLGSGVLSANANFTYDATVGNEILSVSNVYSSGTIQLPAFSTGRLRFGTAANSPTIQASGYSFVFSSANNTANNVTYFGGSATYGVAAVGYSGSGISGVMVGSGSGFTFGSGSTMGTNTAIAGDVGFFRNNGGVVNITDGTSGGLGALGRFKRPISPKTGNYTLLSTDCGYLFSNAGAAGTVTFTLPVAGSGLHYTFIVSAAQSVVVKTGTTSLIYIGTSVSTATTGAQTTPATKGHTLHIYCDGTDWYADCHEGTWTAS